MTGRSLRLAEAALWMLTLLALLTARRLFDSWDYLPLWLILAAGGHATAAVTRRQRWPMATAATIGLVLLAISVSLALYSETLFAGLMPTATTVRRAATDIAAAWDAFGIVEAPTSATPGFLLVGGAVIWLAAVAADTAAFRGRMLTEAMLPSLIMLAFVGALGTDDWRIRSAAAMVVACVAFAAAHGIHHTGGWVQIGPARRRRLSVPMRTALRFGGIVAVGAALIVPLLPGSDAPAIVSWKDLDGTVPASRVTISPLVNAQGRLTGVSGAELFRVRADRPAYWRVSGLGRFDGVVWGSEQLYSDAAELLGAPPPGDHLRQVVTVGALDSIWLPAAFEPVAYDGPHALYDAESGALVTDHSSELEPGFSYTVSSASRVPSLAVLVSATDEVPPEIAENYLELPEGFNERVIGLAADVTADASGPYAKSLALQNFFLKNFAYTLRVPSGHDSDRMEQFLFEDRRGYCEQFSGTYAAMARAVGLPSRVAVGFTPGELVDGEYIVRGEHYHAWPEVWIGDRWVYFEPTPGRGAPGAVAYTGVAPQQVVSGDPEAAGESGSGFIGALGLDDLEGTSGNLEGFVDVLDTEGSTQATGTWAEWIVIPFYAVLAVAGIWFISVPAAVRLRRALHHRRARGNPRATVEASWHDVAERLFELGLDQRLAETHREFAERVDRRVRINASELASLAEATQEACFAAHAPSPQTVVSARLNAHSLEARIQSGRSYWDRVTTACRPVALTGGPRARRRNGARLSERYVGTDAG